MKVRLDVKMVPDLKTGTVWGTLPGATDETVYIIAHRDGWFESGTDNASGVATMVGLAEYFSKIPKESAPPQDHRIRRNHRPSQRREHERDVAAGSSRRNLREDRADDQLRAHFHRPDLSSGRRYPAGEYVHRNAVVRRRSRGARSFRTWR